MTEAGRLLYEHFGYQSFRPAQETLISALLEGRDALGIMPTGAGKSMCYQIPALMLPGITLVISPLISLMQDQVRALKAAGIRGAYLNSSLTWKQYLLALENARHTDMTRFVYSLGIPGIGLQNAKMLNRHFRGSFDALRKASGEELCEIEGIGEVLARAVRDYLDDPENMRLTEDLLKKLDIEAPAAPAGEGAEALPLAGKTFVITGSVTHFKNREELKRFIEDRGGKAAKRPGSWASRSSRRKSS